MPSNASDRYRPGPGRSEILPADAVGGGDLGSLLRKSIVSRITEQSWLIYLFLVSCLGPLTIWSKNIDRILVDTVLAGIALLFIGLVTLRILVAAIIRRPSVTDPILALLAIVGLYDWLFAFKAGTAMTLIWWVVCLLLVALVIVRPGIRAAVPQAICIFFTLTNLMILGHVVWSGDLSRRDELRAALADQNPPLPAP